MWVLRSLAVALAITIAALPGCGGSKPNERPLSGSEHHDSRNRLSAEIPQGWQVVDRPISLVVYPEQILAATSHPIDLRGVHREQCSPGAALDQIPADGALVQVIEYTRHPRVGDLPPRPDTIRYSDGRFAPYECAGWSFQFAFTDRGRAIQAHVWLDRDRVESEVRREALELINSLELERSE